LKREKYARLEARIRSGSDVDDEEEEPDAYFDRIKSSYDPIAESRELRRKEKEEEQLDAKNKLEQATSREAFERWQEREAKVSGRRKQRQIAAQQRYLTA
jgi:hypothetical protein